MEPTSTAQTDPVAAAHRVRRYRVIFWAGLALWVTFVGCLWGVRIQATLTKTKLTALDALAPPGQDVTLAIKLEKDGPGLVNPDLAGVTIRFRFDNSWHGAEQTARTDGDGVAQVTLKAPATAGVYAFTGEPVKADELLVRDTQLRGFLFVVAADSPMIICDIDRTVTAGEDYKSLLDGPGPDPLPDAASTLSELARTHTVVFLTARDEALLNRTRLWLAEHGFPVAPVLCRDWTLFNMTKAGEIKLAMLKALQQRFSRIVHGIGNSKGDCEAYGGAGIPHITLEHVRCKGTEEAKDPPRCRAAKDWREVRKMLTEEKSG